ncbi:MAG: hypothetical protein ACOC3J_01410 [Gemmatimonadota bacterium]
MRKLMKAVSSSGRFARRALVILVAGGAFAACDAGENRFERQAPELHEFTPNAESVAEGDTLTFTIDASGPRTITKVRLVLSGALEGDTIFDIEEPSTDVGGTVWIAIPEGTGPSAQLTVTAWAIDVAPDTSDERTATVQVTDATPPTATATVTPDQVGAGETIQIAVAAMDNRGVASLGAVVTDGAAYDTTLAEAVDPARVELTRTFELVAPEIDLGRMTVTPFAEDVNGMRSDGDSAVVTLADLHGPTFRSLETDPDSTIPLGDSLQVVVELADPAGIQRVTFVGLAYRGDASMGTDSVVERFETRTIEFPRPTQGPELPTEYELDPFLYTSDLDETEPVEISVIAEDALGNVSDTTKLMYVGGPDVAITYPPDGFGVGLNDQFSVRIAIEDATGIDSAQLVLSGDLNEVIALDSLLPARTDTPFVLIRSVQMPDVEGEVRLQARAWNPAEVSGQSRTVTVPVLQEAPSDTEPPVVSVTAERLVPTDAGDRMELLDRIRVTVSAFDNNSGLARVGMKAVAARAGVQHEITDHVLFNGSKSLEQFVFEVPVDSLYALFGIHGAATLDSILPESIDLRIHGFAADTTGQVACAVGTDEQRPCDPDTYAPDQYYEAADTAGLLLEIEAVRGVTVLLENRDATIADLAIDTVDDRLFLSNITDNLVEFLQLDADFRQNRFNDPVQVGSEPWGIFIGEREVSDAETGFGGISVTPGERARTLIVSNSGGTNMSLVHLDPNASLVQEVDVVRLRTPNSILYEIKEESDDFGGVRYTVEHYDLADRPQFLAQDSLLRIVYSTLGTEAAPTTTVRFVHVNPDPGSGADRPEDRFLLTGDMVDSEDESTVVLANVDSILVKPVALGSDSVRVFMHEPGYPDRVIYNTEWQAQIADAIAIVNAQLQAVMDARGMGTQAPMFYPFYMRGTWDFDALAWSDTTFVSASGDRGTIAIGEGAESPTGRIMLWHGEERAQISDEVQIGDLVNNASEQVLGVGLNQNGSLGVARGLEATYFFTPDLRLQGLYRQEELGGAGAAFHPEHDAVTDGGHTDGTGAGAAFTGTSEHSIDVVNTFHFNQVNKLVIRDDVVGPLRAGPPLATDNAGLTCPTDLDCVVAKLYGITSAGGVVIVNVRRRDLEPYAAP